MSSGGDGSNLINRRRVLSMDWQPHDHTRTPAKATRCIDVPVCNRTKPLTMTGQDRRRPSVDHTTFHLEEGLVVTLRNKSTMARRPFGASYCANEFTEASTEFHTGVRKFTFPVTCLL